MSVPAMTIAMLLTGAGEVQRGIPIEPHPPVPMVVPPAPPVPSPPASRAVSAPQRARASLQTYFSRDDYPASALRNKEQGATYVRIIVGPDGRVSGCAVVGSSGSTALDQATCRILRRRARYSPARDRWGMPTRGTDSERIRWVLPPPG